MEGSPGLAGRWGQSPAPRMLGVPGAAGLPAPPRVRSLPWICEMKAISCHLHFYLTFWSKGLGVPLAPEVFSSSCPFINQSHNIDTPGEPHLPEKLQSAVGRGDGRDRSTPCNALVRLESHCPYGVKLHSGHSSEVSHSTDGECQPALPTKQQLKTTQ